jgi:Raf kinase inhibitor-like YbhB/YbcL family protein
MRLESSAFKSGDTIPHRYTCMGEDLSPPLHWGVPPAATKSFAIIVEDPNAQAGTWVHWVIYNIPLDLRGLTEGIPTKDHLPNGAMQGLNDFKRIGYGGPCPPPGKSHRYYFKLYALDTTINLKPCTTKHQVSETWKRHVLAEASLMGRFGR